MLDDAISQSVDLSNGRVLLDSQFRGGRTSSSCNDSGGEKITESLCLLSSPCRVDIYVLTVFRIPMLHVVSKVYAVSSDRF